MRRLRVALSLGLCVGGAGMLQAGMLQTGCAGHTRVEGRVAVQYPRLVYVSPGLWVLADSNDPIFYSDGYYWLYRDGVWFNSFNYWGDWTYQPVVRVPVVIRSVRRPVAYRRYRARPGQQTRRVSPTVDHRRKTRPPARRNEKVPSRRGTPPR